MKITFSTDQGTVVEIIDDANDYNLDKGAAWAFLRSEILLKIQNCKEYEEREQVENELPKCQRCGLKLNTDGLCSDCDIINCPECGLKLVGLFCPDCN